MGDGVLNESGAVTEALPTRASLWCGSAGASWAVTCGGRLSHIPCTWRASLPCGWCGIIWNFSCLRRPSHTCVGCMQIPYTTIWLCKRNLSIFGFFCLWGNPGLIHCGLRGCCSVTKSCLTASPWPVAHQAPLPSIIAWCLLKFMSFELVMLSNHLILCFPLLLSSLFPSIMVFNNELALRIRWWKYWSFNFIWSCFNEYLVLIFFRIDQFDLLAIQGTLKCLLQHHSSKTSFIWWSAFFMIQLTHLYTTTGKTIVLTIWTFVGSEVSTF